MEKGIAVRNIDDVERLARIAITSGYTACRKPEEAAMLILTGAELGLSPMLALRGIYVVSGKPVLSADLMVAVIRRSGQCESWRVVESTGDRCTITTRRRGESHDATRTWTMADAKRAGVTGKSVWAQYPAAMLRHRCAADLAREVYPDVLMGLYDPEELGGEPEVEAEAERGARIVDAQPITRETVAALGIEAQQPAPTADLVADLEMQVCRCGDVSALADLWVACRGDVAALPKGQQSRAWKIIGQRAEAIGATAAAVRAEVQRRDTPTPPDGPKGGAPKPEHAEHTEASGESVTTTTTAQDAQAIALVPPWCSDVESMERHIAGYAHYLAVERCARKHRSGLPAAARELMALRLQRLSWDPHDGEITIESARELVARWIAAGPVERVRPAARAAMRRTG